MILRLLNFLDRTPFKRILLPLISLGYWSKGFGFVRARYHPAFRAYQYKVKGTTYMSAGPGWAYSFGYLENSLKNSYCHDYLPKKGDCVVDIGAGLGEETVIYAQLVGDSGKVFAVEANPTVFEGLNFMCLQNKFHWVHPRNVAVYKSDGFVLIEDDKESYLKNTINSSTPGSVKVPARTFDSIIKENGISTIDFLKVNIEGAEQFLILGMSQSAGIIRNLCISCHDFRQNFHNDGEFYLTKQKVTDFLKSSGFEVKLRNTGNPLVDDYVYARNTNS